MASPCTTLLQVLCGLEWATVHDSRDDQGTETAAATGATTAAAAAATGGGGRVMPGGGAAGSTSTDITVAPGSPCVDGGWVSSSLPPSGVLAPVWHTRTFDVASAMARPGRKHRVVFLPATADAASTPDSVDVQAVSLRSHAFQHRRLPISARCIALQETLQRHVPAELGQVCWWRSGRPAAERGLHARAHTEPCCFVVGKLNVAATASGEVGPLPEAAHNTPLGRTHARPCSPLLLCAGSGKAARRPSALTGVG